MSAKRDLRSFWAILNVLHKAVVLSIVALVAYAIGSASLLSRPKFAKYELMHATPPALNARSGSGSCVEPNQQERQLVETAVDVLAFPADQSGWLAIGAHKLLSAGLYRAEEGRIRRVCDLPEHYERAAKLIGSSDHLRRGRITEYGLRLIARLPSRSDVLVETVAKSAFNVGAQASDNFPNRDIRPFARAVLASLGPAARPYADQAYAQISIADSMGTGAAQIAVAAGHPKALETVERLMAEKLAALPADGIVPWNARNRLYELAYALALGGDQAEPHAGPLRDLMSRKVQSWAPPFGMIELPPRRMCSVLGHIVGTPASTLGFEYCAEKDKPLEQ